MELIFWFGILYFLYLQYKDYIDMSPNFRNSMLALLSLPVVGAFFVVIFTLKIMKGITEFYKKNFTSLE